MRPLRLSLVVVSLLVGLGCAPTARPSTAAAPAQPAAPSGPPAPSAAAAAGTQPAAFDEQAIAAFYRGKTVRIVVGFAPGGGYDVIARQIAPYLEQHIPGRPRVIVENRPGGGSMLVANMVYRVEPQDGTVIGLASERLPLRQAMGLEGVEFDAARSQWLSSFTSNPGVCAVRRDLGITDVREAISARKELSVASSGGGTTERPLMMNATIGTRFKVIQPYDSTPKMKLATEAGEVDGFCTTWESFQQATPDWFERDPAYVVPLVTIGPPADASERLLQGVPRAEDLAIGERARRLLAVFGAMDAAQQPFQFGPGVPADRVAAVRVAFERSWQEPALLEDIRRTGRIARPLSGEQVADLVREVLQTPPDILQELREIVEGRRASVT